ncbi:MAG: hypothetical protein DRN83_02510 [Hadesarchaea archaeon]|nr:MAG: hypothetical protein DRN83_02510 [Hadesarchaea archaeon]HDI12682.1 hypothetical protein [Hadesarchaea archaeon]
MKILASNHSSYPRVGDGPGEQKHRQAYTRMERGEISEEEFERVQDEITKEVIQRQISAALDIVTDGQIRWHDPISHLARHLEGCEINGLLRFFDTNFYFRQPVVKGDLRRRRPILKREFEFAKKVSAKLLKPVITGPYTLAKLSINRSGSGLRSVVKWFTKVVSEEIADLVEAGASLIQIEEPAILRNPGDWEVFQESIEELVSSKGSSDLLLCTYFGDAAPLYQKLSKLPVDGLVLDFTYSPKLPETISRFGGGKKLGLGVVDGRNTRMENSDEMTGVLRRIISTSGPEEIHVMPSCGLGDYLPSDVAFQKLKKVVEITNTVRASL